MRNVEILLRYPARQSSLVRCNHGSAAPRWALIGAWLALAVSCFVFGQNVVPLYRNDFSKAEIGKVPDDLVVLDGSFAINEEQGNKFLELPGAPLDSYGVLFGPAVKGGADASVRVFGTAKGRRYPTFALGLNGVGGYRIQVSPGKKALELFRGDQVKASVPYSWQPGAWTHLRLKTEKRGSTWRIEGKAWSDGKSEPVEWLISADEPSNLPEGRASVFGSPFSGTPIRFDDLTVRGTDSE